MLTTIQHRTLDAIEAELTLLRLTLGDHPLTVMEMAGVQLNIARVEFLVAAAGHIRASTDRGAFLHKAAETELVRS